MSAGHKARPKYYDLNLAHHWPPAVLSIFHRVSGALLFFPVLPLLLYALQSTLGSEAGYARWHDWLGHPLAKLLLIGASWFYAHHFFAGLRYLVLDAHIATGKAAARATALAVFAAGAVATLLFAWWLW